MLKKLLLIAIVGLAVFFVNIDNEAEASDVFVGTSPATGWNCYIMTETIRLGNRNYGATLKMFTRSGNIKYLDYYFYLVPNSGGEVAFKNSQGYTGYVNQYDTPIEWAMWQVIMGRRSPKAY